MFDNPELMLLRIPAILLALTVHEFAHGYVAYIKGDDTAHQEGRLSFNPLAHLDLFGTLMLMFGPFGWAKPVPVNPYNLANPRKDMAWVALAGPLSNMILAIILGLLFRFIYPMQILPPLAVKMLFIGVQINLGLAIFNLLPVAPLDGSKIVMGLLPLNKVAPFAEAMKYAPKILFGILIFGFVTDYSPLSIIFSPWFNFWNAILLGW